MRTVDQCTSFSESPKPIARASRLPSTVTPVASTTARDLIVQLCFGVDRIEKHLGRRRAHQWPLAACQRVRPHGRCRRRSVKRRPRHARITPGTLTRPSAFPVDVPVTYAVMITPTTRVDSPTRLQQLTDVAALTELGETSPPRTRRVRDRPRPRAVAHPAPTLRAFPATRTQPGRDLRLDELLQRVLHDRG